MKKYLLVGAVALVFLVVGISAAIFYQSENPIQAGRPSYEGINSTVFADLPDYPARFTLIKRNFYDGQINDFTRLNSSFWKQPEFYPTWESNGIFWFTRHDYNRWGVHGYGLFPSEISYTAGNMSQGDGFSVYTLIHTSWGIETWQGIKINPVYNTTLFDVKIEPDVLLLDPTFPKFYYNWTQMLRYSITAKQQIPKGQYEFSLYISSPATEQSKIWTWDVLDKYTNNLYHEQILECRKQLSDKCNSLLEMRQNKYVVGGQYAPSNLFTAFVTVD